MVLLPLAVEHGLLRALQAQRAAACRGAMRNVRVTAAPAAAMLVTAALFFGVSFGAMKGLMAPVDERLARPCATC